MPRLFEKNPEQKDFKIWSSACATGQEPFSLAMTILDNPEWAYKYKFEINATDLSTKVLEKAAAGTYSQFEVQRGVPISSLLKHFKQDGENWIINDKVKDMVKFSKVNLIESLLSLGNFDVIFCRNVLIYFETETVVKILHQFSKILNPNGVLVIGGTENIIASDLFVALEDTTNAYVLK
jgi:chemotaxis protein methyltransferase CheR